MSDDAAYRSEATRLVEMMPMRVVVQREGDRWLATMPGWQLPATGLLCEGASEQEALDALHDRMRAYWMKENSDE